MELSGVVDYGATLDRYTWDQDRVSVSCSVTKEQLCKVTGRSADLELTARDLQIKMTLTHLSFAVKQGNEPFFNADFPNRINTDDSTWTFDKENQVVEFELSKDMTVHNAEEPWWPSFLQGEPEIDVEFIKAAKHLDVSLLRRIKAEKSAKKEAEAAAAQAST